MSMPRSRRDAVNQWVRLLLVAFRVPHYRVPHQGLSEGCYTSREHEKQRSNDKVRYRLADLQPRTWTRNKSVCKCVLVVAPSVRGCLPVSVTLKKNIIVITILLKRSACRIAVTDEERSGRTVSKAKRNQEERERWHS